MKARQGGSALTEGLSDENGIADQASVSKVKGYYRELVM